MPPTAAMISAAIPPACASFGGWIGHVQSHMMTGVSTAAETPTDVYRAGFIPSSHQSRSIDEGPSRLLRQHFESIALIALPGQESSPTSIVRLGYLCEVEGSGVPLGDDLPRARVEI